LQRILNRFIRRKGTTRRTRPCVICRARGEGSHGKYQAQGEWIDCPMRESAPAPQIEEGRKDDGGRTRCWIGQALSAEPEKRTARTRRKTDMMPWELQGAGDLIEVDLSSVEQRVLEERDDIRVTVRNNVVTIFKAGIKAPTLLNPWYNMWKERRGDGNVAEMWRELTLLQEWEEQNGRVPAWPMQERLCNVDGADILIGIHPALLSPFVPEGWKELDPDDWSDEQREKVAGAKALVVYLDATDEAQTRLVQHLRPLTRDGTKILFVSPKRASGPVATRVPDMLKYAKLLVTLTAKCPVWMGKHQWGRKPGYVAKGGLGLTIWGAGPRDRERSLRVKDLLRGWEKTMQEHEWVGEREPQELTRAFLDEVEARKWEGGEATLAATDGSVENETGRMGAGYVFSMMNAREHAPGSIEVGGDPASLRAEAAALAVLLEDIEDDEELVVLIDSLGLLQIIQNWTRFDFSPKRDMQEHYDLIARVMALLLKRRVKTTLVKVKSHSGVPLNERADEQAQVREEGDQMIRFAPEEREELIKLADGETGTHQVRRRIENRTRELKWEELRTADSITAKTLFTEGMGQKYFRRAKARLTHRCKRRMLQVMGGVFPCNMWRKRINVCYHDTCVLCGKKDTYSHRVCSCKQMHDAITLGHDNAWRALYENLIKHVPDKTGYWFDTKLASIPLSNLSCSVGTAGKYKPDGLVEMLQNRTLYLLEFTRTSDMWEDSLERANVRKRDKKGYKLMIEALKKARPGWNVNLITFVLGDRGFFNEDQWKENWNRLKLPECGFKHFAVLAVQMAHEVADDILQAYNGAIAAQNARTE